MSLDKFYSLAEKFGHDLQALKDGKTETSEILFNSIDEIRAFINDIGGPSTLPSTGSDDSSKEEDCGCEDGEEALVLRLHEYIYSGKALTNEHRETIKGQFPVKLTATSLPNLCVQTNAGYIIDDSPQCHDAYNIGTLTLCPGAYIKVVSRSVTLHFTNIVKYGAVGTGTLCDGKVCVDANGAKPKPYDIAILGTTGATGAPGAPQSGIPTAGADGVDGVCSSSTVARDATKGLTGNTGDTGNQPNLTSNMNGRPNYPAKIIIQGLTGSGSSEFTIVSKSGTGGQGGTGGKGGAGSKGGRGGLAAVYCACITTGCAGGPGGRGGRGGTGGIGGNAADGKQSHLLAPQAILNIITLIDDQPVPGGVGGAGGPGGIGGTGGAGAPAVVGSTNTSPKASDGAKGGTGPSANQGGSGPKAGNAGTILKTVL
jgi:hypothetical protein